MHEKIAVATNVNRRLTVVEVATLLVAVVKLDAPGIGNGRTELDAKESERLSKLIRQARKEGR